MITIKMLFDDPSLSDSTILAGSDGMDNEIKTLTVVDAPDSYQWFKGGEFVLTSAYIFENDINTINTFILRLIEAEASGIGIKLGRFVDFISQTTIQLCNDYDFPIIQIPYNLVWTDIISPFYELHYQLKEENVTIEITPNMIMPLYEASRWSSIRLMKKLSEYFSIPIAIYKQNKHLIANNTFYGVENIQNAVLKIKKLPSRGEFSRISMDNFICTFAVLPLSYDGQREYIAFASKDEHSISNIEEFISLLYKLSGNNISTARSTEDLFRDLIYRISTSNITKNELLDFEHNFKSKNNIEVFTGIIVLFSENNELIFNKIKKYVDRFNDTSRHKCSIYINSDSIVQKASLLVVMEISKTVNLNIFIRNLMDFLTPRVPCSSHIAISAMKKGFEHLNQSFRLTEKTLKTGEIISPLRRIYYYPEIAMFTMLGIPQLTTLNFDDVNTLIVSNKSLLFDVVLTLEIFLESTNYKEASKKLFIHENTLRYRIKKISETLDLSFENPTENYNMLNQIKLWRLKTYYDNSEDGINTEITNNIQ